MAEKQSRLVQSARGIAGSLLLPGDKSISHRYAMLAAIANGRSEFQNFSTGADCASTLACLLALGCRIEHRDNKLCVTGSGPALKAPKFPLDCGNSGSTMRMLAGILCAQEFTSELVGDESLSRRPMARIIEPLTKMGAAICAAKDARPPLKISNAGALLHGIDYKIPVPSAQVKSSILFAATFAKGETSVEEPVRTRDHGELALGAFGAELHRSRGRITLTGRQQLTAIQAAIPGDISSAAFFLCAAAIFPGSKLIIDHVLLNPTRASLLDVLTGLGARIQVINLSEQHGELAGTVKIEYGVLRGTKISGPVSVALIDELPVLAAIAPFTSSGIEVCNARELRVKESDRIAMVTRNLRAMGATVEEHDDGWKIAGNQQLHGAEIDSGRDHRIAMAFSIAALRATGDTLIHGVESVAISFPEFFSMLDAIAQH
jgi:3-phosphoshikimate 1-carboxyvinyltransferase